MFNEVRVFYPQLQKQISNMEERCVQLKQKFYISISRRNFVNNLCTVYLLTVCNGLYVGRKK